MTRESLPQFADPTNDVPRGTSVAEPTLEWLKPELYHQATKCGRYTVAKHIVGGVDWYIAYRRQPRPRMSIREPVSYDSVELGGVQVTPRATDAERKAAIGTLRAMCEADALEKLGSMP